MTEDIKLQNIFFALKFNSLLQTEIKKYDKRTDFHVFAILLADIKNRLDLPCKAERITIK